ncbi:MAG: 1-deoxy-D-xylulose-5-phosphate synthase [Moraxellaceae bacterium]|nr:1-deoxy-D-xylulose-5-phosphate synthase [Moraxellaceae bacterium]
MNNTSSIPTHSKKPREFQQIPQIRPLTPLLDKIDSPKDLKKLNTEQLLTLADELREYLLYSVGVSGGHFGANLGVVELTIALHYLLDTPNDQLLWDVGHQAYAHKALTGRREQLPTIRSKGGLTAFPERCESVYDAFGVGHSSTVISAGLGMSLAMRYRNKQNKVACVVGDGAMTAGMAFEAMNDAVHNNADLLVVLNDNDMSISCATGGFPKHLATLWQAGYQIDIDEQGEPAIRIRPDMNDYESRSRHHEQSDVPISVDNVFRAIGFHYFGPFDGHNLPELVRVLERAKKIQAPVLVHVYTIKGKGFTPAYADPVGYHAIGKIPSQQITHTPTKTDNSLKYSQVFGKFICDKAEIDDKLLAITPAMEEGSGMTEFAKRFPQRFFDVAIAEQHAVTLASGMATQGVKPIVAIYSSFLQRGYDQLVHDVALQNLDVTFAIDRAGLVGEDGATHAGVFDYAFMRCLPNMVIACPKDENECYHLLNTCYEYKGVSAVRYPRGKGTGAVIKQPLQTYPIGKAKIEFNKINNNAKNHLAILAFGTMFATAEKVAKKLIENNKLSITVVNMRWLKPLDTVMIDKLIAQGVTHFATIEEHVLMGGAGSAVNEYMVEQEYNQKVKISNIGIPDRYIAHGSHQEQLADCGLDFVGVFRKLKEVV